MTTALSRHWHTLRLIPRAPRKIDTATLTAKLADRGYHIDQRSVQRDLNKLSGPFPLICDTRSRPYGWSWSRDAVSFDIPGMDMHTALAFRLAAEHLAPLLPSATVADLRPHFSRAKQTLAAMEGGVSAWASAVRTLPAGLPRLPAQVDRDVLEAVHTGLLRQQRLQLRYLPRGVKAAKRYVANPLGLVYRDGSGYLVASLWDYDNVLQLALSRLQSAELLAEPRHVPPGFELDTYLASGAFGFQVSDAPVALVAWLAEGAAFRLREAPLSIDQRLTELADGRVELRATLPDTQALRVWLRGHGALCEVREPASLRAELAAEARSLAGVYGGDA